MSEVSDSPKRLLMNDEELALFMREINAASASSNNLPNFLSNMTSNPLSKKVSKPVRISQNCISTSGRNILPSKRLKTMWGVQSMTFASLGWWRYVVKRAATTIAVDKSSSSSSSVEETTPSDSTSSVDHHHKASYESEAERIAYFAGIITRLHEDHQVRESDLIDFLDVTSSHSDTTCILIDAICIFAYFKTAVANKINYSVNFLTNAMPWNDFMASDGDAENQERLFHRIRSYDDPVPLWHPSSLFTPLHGTINGHDTLCHGVIEVEGGSESRVYVRGVYLNLANARVSLPSLTGFPDMVTFRGAFIGWPTVRSSISPLSPVSSYNDPPGSDLMPFKTFQQSILAMADAPSGTSVVLHLRNTDVVRGNTLSGCIIQRPATNNVIIIFTEPKFAFVRDYLSLAAVRLPDFPLTRRFEKTRSDFKLVTSVKVSSEAQPIFLEVEKEGSILAYSYEARLYLKLIAKAAYSINKGRVFTYNSNNGFCNLPVSSLQSAYGGLKSFRSAVAKLEVFRTYLFNNPSFIDNQESQSPLCCVPDSWSGLDAKVDIVVNTPALEIAIIKSTLVSALAIRIGEYLMANNSLPRILIIAKPDETPGERVIRQSFWFSALLACKDAWIYTPDEIFPPYLKVLFPLELTSVPKVNLTLSNVLYALVGWVDYKVMFADFLGPLAAE